MRHLKKGSICKIRNYTIRMYQEIKTTCENVIWGASVEDVMGMRALKTSGDASIENVIGMHALKTAAGLTGDVV